MTKEEKIRQINNAVEYYKNSEQTVKEVAMKFQISQCTLSKHLKLNEIEVRKVPKPNSKSNKLNTISEELKNKQGDLSKSQFKKLLINLAIEEYINTSIYERSIQKLSDKYGLNRKTIVKYLNEREIEITNTHGKIPFNENVFDTIDTEEKAYWLGFLYADGCVSSSDNEIEISLKDKEHLEKFQKAIKEFIESV